MKGFCPYNEYEIAGEYEDAGKPSKSTVDCLAFNKMIEDIKAGKELTARWKVDQGYQV